MLTLCLDSSTSLVLRGGGEEKEIGEICRLRCTFSRKETTLSFYLPPVYISVLFESINICPGGFYLSWAELHRRQLSHSSSQISVLCTIFLPDFSFTIEENLLEITMKGTMYRFLKICHKKIIIF